MSIIPGWPETLLGKAAEENRKRQDKTAVAPPMLPEMKTRREPDLNEYGELPTGQRIMRRANLLLEDPKEALRKTFESVYKTHGDVMLERLGEFEGREAMGDSLDREHNKWYNPIGNWRHKEEFRKALHGLGKNRYPVSQEKGKGQNQ